MNTTTTGAFFAHQKPFHLPCLAPAGARIFAPTADQRFLAGQAEFLRTHFPVEVQHHTSGISDTLMEQDILHGLLEPSQSVVGNRIFILYGAAGSGKSELIRWLQTQIFLQDISRADVTLRISRTDLDIFHIVQRFQQTYGLRSFQTNTLQRWEECRQKPRTVAKILVLTALEQLLNSDEQINALYYQLIDRVQTNLERCFTATAPPTEDTGQYIELFSREDLTEILRDSVVPVTIEYEKLRYYILKSFRDQLLEGIDFSQILKQIAQLVQSQKQQRPVLFIDDLVQSINLFATDLLDYFLTLEEGCWDVIIGITPSSLDATLRGKELLKRIAFLDTIDDRVQKLWLSDEGGFSSSFLNETNCTEYARLYLNEYKQQNQQACNTSCPAFQLCHCLDPKRQDNLLAPFNKEMLIRLFRSLPPGKGKARYYTLYLRDMLERITRGEDPVIVAEQYIKIEQAVYHADRRVAQIYELFGPLADTEIGQINDDITHLFQFFNVQVTAENSLKPVIAPLYKSTVQEQFTIADHRPSIDPGKEAITAWLRGKQVNKQQLRNLRRGVVKAIKEGYVLDIMTRSHTAKPTRILRWVQTRLDTIPPVQLEEVDEFDGVGIQRSIGPLAYLLHDFADAIGLAEQDMRGQILAHQIFPHVFFQSQAYYQDVHNELERQLRMPVEEFAFCLFMVAHHLGYHSVDLSPSISSRLGMGFSVVPRYPESIETERPRLTNGQLGVIRRLFEDCFKLRENVYDGLLLETLTERLASEKALELLMSIDTTVISSDFHLNEEPLGSFVDAIHHEIRKLINLKASQRGRDVLIFTCSAEPETYNVSNQLAELLKLKPSIETGQSVSHFMDCCDLFDLHRVFCLAYMNDVAQYERSISQLQLMLQEYDTGEEIPAQLFTKVEADLLLTFSQQGFRIPMNQFDASLLAKVAHYFPDLYKRLELRLQRG